MKQPLRVSSARWSYSHGLRRVLRTVFGCATLAVLTTALVSACSSGSTPTTPPSFPQSGSSSGGSSPATPTASASGTPSATTPSTPSPSVPASSAPASSAAAASPPPPSPGPPSPASPELPAQAPSTGGGGTAGFQHLLLFCLGILAILAGAGGIAYRRKAMRDR